MQQRLRESTRLLSCDYSILAMTSGKPSIANDLLRRYRYRDFALRLQSS
jgi:hypothetical protein